MESVSLLGYPQCYKEKTGPNISGIWKVISCYPQQEKGRWVIKTNIVQHRVAVCLLFWAFLDTFEDLDVLKAGQDIQGNTTKET